MMKYEIVVAVGTTAIMTGMMTPVIGTERNRNEDIGETKSDEKNGNDDEGVEVVVVVSKSKVRCDH